MSETENIAVDEDISDEEAIERLEGVFEDINEQFLEGEVPEIESPQPTTSNIEYDEDKDVWVYGDKTRKRRANSVRDAKKLLQTVYATRFIIQQLREGRSSTKREIYYISESFDNKYAQFNDQSESDKTIEFLERMLEITREDMHIRPEESGATIIGPLTVVEQTRRGERQIHCQKDIGEGGYQIPSNPDSVEFVDHDADFVLAVETGGMRDRLVENGFDEKHNCIVVHLKGQPARATRRIIKRLNDELDLPVAVFTDGDPWSYRIYGSVAYGSAKSAHLSEYLATPEAKFIGIEPSDIVEYDLPTDPLSDSDVNALESEQDDPRFKNEDWREEIELQLDIGKKSEQQSLAKHGLDFVSDTYLPEKLREKGIID